MASPLPSRAIVASLACALAAAGCSASAPPALSCTTSLQCPATARCISGACVANAAPAAAVALPPAPLRSNVLLSFDASASADPDAGDAIASFAWAFRAVSSPACGAPAVAGTGPAAVVRFGCPGRYAVDVAATDSMGATGTVSTQFDVAPYDGPALLAVGADVSVDHLCTAAPRCTTTAPVALSAATPGIPSEGVSFAWSVVPPHDRPLSPTRRVTFTPSAADAAPTVELETDGDAISGDWIFHVAASDGAGLIGAADVRVSVGNHPPRIGKTLPTPDHAFAGSQFTASGEVPFTVSDDDGDPLLAPEVEWRHSGDGASTFTGNLLPAPDRVSFIIAVPYATRDDAAHLIGAPGLDRTILFAVSDVNGARTAESWPIGVANRPPQLVTEPAGVAVDHAFDPVALAYTADAPLSTWTDPDGDPLFPADGASTGDPDCAQLVLPTGSGVAHAACRLAFSGAPAVANFAGSHTVVQTVQDPWAPAAAASRVTFDIGNRAPALTSTATFNDAACDVSTSCCKIVEGVCDAYAATTLPQTRVPSRWTDPDGDPFSVGVGTAGPFTPAPLVCVPGVSSSCALDVAVAAVPVCGSSGVTSLPVTLDDGAALTAGTLPIQVTCF